MWKEDNPEAQTETCALETQGLKSGRTAFATPQILTVPLGCLQSVSSLESHCLKDLQIRALIYSE